MKTPKVKRLPSGNWNVQIQVNGKRYSCTGSTKKEAQDKAKAIYAGAELEKRTPLTVGKAIDNYILEKTGTLSPSTIRGYKAARKNYLQSIMDINVSDLTQSDIQFAVSSDAIDGKSPKTIKNAHGLLTATLNEFRPNFKVNTKLPQKEVHDISIPSEDEMKKIWKAAKGTKYELPILLASWLGLRVSEIIGLKYCDIFDGAIHVQRALVPDSDGNLVEKGTKTVSGNRWIAIPKEIQDLIGTNDDPEERVCPMTRAAIYHGFIRACKKAGVEPYRFHDLRHFSASEAHALGIPDKYVIKRMGHATDNMLKTVYQHTMKNKEDEFGKRIDKKMRKLYV